MSDDKITAAHQYAGGLLRYNPMMGAREENIAKAGFRAGAEWQAAPQPSSQCGEAVAWMNPHGGEVVSAAEKHSMETFNGVRGRTLAQRYSQPLYTNPQPQPAVPESDWIACSERLPTVADADCNYHVWAHDRAFTRPEYSQCLCIWSAVRDVADITHWKPTGLKRPEPPEET